MCNKSINRCFFVFDSVPDQYKSQEMCDRFVSKCDEAVDDDYLATLKLILEWFVTSKTIKGLFTTLHADKNILYFNEDSGNVVCSCNEMGILNINLNNINPDNNFDEDDLDTMIHIRILTWHIKFEKRKAL